MESTSKLLCANLREALPEHTGSESRGECGILAARFLAVARSSASRPALRTAHGCWTYSDLASLAKSVAAGLVADRSYQPGDRVVLMVPNSAEYIAGFYGILLAGGVVVPIPVDMESDRLQSILDATEASHGLTTSGTLSRWPTGSSERFQPIDVTIASGAADSESVEGDMSAEELAAIFFTSGSSGTPKGVMLSHSNLLSNAESIQQYLEIDESERALAVLPFPHAFGNSVLQSHLLAGAELVLDGSPVFPESILDALREHQCTSFSAVPDLFRTLCERTSLGERELPSLRYMAVAGGALPHPAAERVAQSIAPARFFTMYGQTEATARLAYLPPEQLADRPGCLGHGIPGVELAVVDDQGAPVKQGCVGEIRARGPNIMLGYWRDPVSTAEILREGWLHTGDLATVDESGRIYVRGRKNAIIKIAGYRVHPREIEDFVIAHCPVADAVVVPFDNPQAEGVRLALFVRPTSDSAESLTDSNLLNICRRHLPRHRIPDVAQIVSQFPLTSSMKVDRQRLAQTAGVLAADRRRVA